jgi:uncharacterized Zn-finger protein
MSKAIVVEAGDLNGHGGVYCPNPKADMKLWNSHPKVYLDVAKTGEAKCPYCGTEYKLKLGETEQLGKHH